MHDIDSRQQKIPEATQTRRTWLIAAVAAVAVLVVGAFGLLAISVSREPTADDGVAIIEALHEAMLSGDWEAIQAAYSPDATYAWVAQGGDDISSGMLSNATGAFPVVFAYSDWDGDGRTTILDQLISNEMMQYANGRSELGPCSIAPDDLVVCNQPSGGAFFQGADPIYGGTWTYTVADGLVTHVELDITSGGSGDARSRAIDFQNWIRETAPELETVLFIPGSPGAAWVKPDNVEAFRARVAEWSSGSPPD